MKKKSVKPKAKAKAANFRWLVEGLRLEYADMIMRMDKDIYLINTIHGKDSVVAKFADHMMARIGYFETRVVDVLNPRINIKR